MGIITQEGLPENCDSAYISIYICASFLACLSSSLPGEEEDQSPAMLMMNVPAKLFVLACLFVIISARIRGSEPCKRNEGIESCFCKDEGWHKDFKAVKENCDKTSKYLVSCICNDGMTWMGKPCGNPKNVEACYCEDGKYCEGMTEVARNCGRHNLGFKVKGCSCKDGYQWPGEY